MGQQQLLLLVLGIVIVGIAIVVGINAYSENNIKTNWDALLQDALRVASDAQAWKGKPELFGGSPDATKATAADYSAVTSLTVLGYPAEPYVSLNGSITVAGAAGGLTITADNIAPLGNQVVLLVTGIREADVCMVSALRDNIDPGLTYCAAATP